MLVTFKAKVETIRYSDGRFYCSRIKVPRIKRHHVDMREARDHKHYGSYANSDLFVGMLNGAVRKVVGDSGYIKTSEPLPEGVTVDTSGFLAVVRVEI